MRMSKKEKEIWAEIEKSIEQDVNVLMDEMFTEEMDVQVEKDLEQWRKDNPNLVKEDKKLLEKQAKWLGEPSQVEESGKSLQTAKGKLRDEIVKTYNRFLKDSGAHLQSTRNSITKNSVQLFRSKVGYRICFSDKKCTQEQLDNLNEKYGIIVHYDHKHDQFAHNIKNFRYINAKNIDNPTKGYLEITNLNEEEAVTIFKELSNIIK